MELESVIGPEGPSTFAPGVPSGAPDTGSLYHEAQLQAQQMGFHPYDFDVVSKIAEQMGGGGGGGKMLPAGSLQTLSEMQSALNSLGQLQSAFEESKGAFAPILGNIRGAIPWDKTGQRAKSTIFLVRQIIGKGLEDGEMCELGKMMEQGNYLTVKEAADLLNLTDRQIYYRIYTGDIECVMVAGSIRISERSLK